MTKLLKRSFDFRRIRAKRWYAPILQMMAGVNVAVYGLMRWMHTPLPTPQILELAAPLMFFAFFLGALGEELGWSGYITDPMQDRWPPPPATGQSAGPETEPARAARREPAEPHAVH